MRKTLKLTFLTNFFFVCLVAARGDNYEDKIAELLKKNRPIRACEFDSINPICHAGVGMSILISCCAVILVLIFMGLLKGILGLMFFPKLGMCGMNLLVDLPRPMKKYQEPELAGQPVIYDVAGWPIHPQTGKRSVRPLSKNTEFCMNVIFFLTYPFIIIVTMCSVVCFKNYDEEGTDHNVYDNVNTVVFTECQAFHQENSPKCKAFCHQDVYEDGDSTEERDTKYVMEQMGKSSDKLNG
ncbi:uncharacterized protein [Onthophagus taurus]|uniref:uncharacterized protein n=1 Tax=Onthophagus taurus TaxID=166361 RepID=UPI0039BDF197